MNAPISPKSSATNVRMLTPEEAAEFLQISTNTLSVWRSNQRYKLPYYKIGGSLVRYKLEDLIAFAQLNVTTNKTEEENNVTQ